jgi:hypothetical protein
VPTLNEFQFHNKILTKNIQTDGAKEKRNVKGKMSSRSIPKSLSRFEIDGTKEKPFINPSKKLFIKKSSPMSSNLKNWCQETRKSPRSRKQTHNGIQENTKFRE